MKRAPTVLSVHALDPAGEEGLLADAAVCRELQCRPLAVVSALLVAGSRDAGPLAPIPPELIGRQLDGVLARHRPDVIRIGVLCGARQVEAVSGSVTTAAVPHVVLAPVVRLAGDNLVDAGTRAAMRERLFPLSTTLVVRIGDLGTLTGSTCGDLDEIRQATALLREQGARRVLVAGIVRRGRVLDVLDDEGHFGIFDASRVAAPRIPGLAAAHAAALSCQLALGHPLPRAVDSAQRYIAVRLQRGR